MHFVLFSGPPRAGKDTAAKAVVMNLYYKYTMVWEKFSFPHKRAFAGMMKSNISVDGHVPGYEENKNEVIPELGVSYRQWQIDYSEKFMKPLYGEDVFARLLLARVNERKSTDGYLCVISDCGFQVEIDTLIKAVPPKKILFVRLLRDGTSYDGDSRGDVRPNNSDVDYIALYNDKDTEDLEKKVTKLVGGWLDGRSNNR